MNAGWRIDKHDRDGRAATCSLAAGGSRNGLGIIASDIPLIIAVVLAVVLDLNQASVALRSQSLLEALRAGEGGERRPPPSRRLRTEPYIYGINKNLVAGDAGGGASRR